MFSTARRPSKSGGYFWVATICARSRVLEQLAPSMRDVVGRGVEVGVVEAVRVREVGVAGGRVSATFVVHHRDERAARCRRQRRRSAAAASLPERNSSAVEQVASARAAWPGREADHGGVRSRPRGWRHRRSRSTVRRGRRGRRRRARSSILVRLAGG